MGSRWWPLIARWNSWKWLAVMTMPSETFYHHNMNALVTFCLFICHLSVFVLFTNCVSALCLGWCCALQQTTQRQCVAWVWSLGPHSKLVEVFWSRLKNWGWMWSVSASMLAVVALILRPTSRLLLMPAVSLIWGWVVTEMHMQLSFMWLVTSKINWVLILWPRMSWASTWTCWTLEVVSLVQTMLNSNLKRYFYIYLLASHRLNIGLSFLLIKTRQYSVCTFNCSISSPSTR